MYVLFCYEVRLDSCIKNTINVYVETTFSHARLKNEQRVFLNTYASAAYVQALAKRMDSQMLAFWRALSQDVCS